MPVTARLSKAFYDRFGEDIVTELVDWFNLIDATYRNDLRELNELNFARFAAKLEQTMTKAEGAKLEARIDVGLAEVRTELQKGLKEQTRYMFLAWATLMVAILWKG